MIDPKDRNDNPSAYPCWTDRIGTLRGMTLLDYFAAKAMGIAVGMARDNYGNWKTDSMARNAYNIAESMLAERKRRMEGEK